MWHNRTERKDAHADIYNIYGIYGIYDLSRPAPVGQVHAAEAVSTLEAIGIVGIVLDAAVGVRNGQVIDCHVIWTLYVGVVP